MQSLKKASEAEVDKTSASISEAGPSKQLDPTTRASDPTTQASEQSDAQPMDTDFFGPSLPPRFTQSVQSNHGSKHSDPTTRILNPCTRNNLKVCVLPELKSTRTRKTQGSFKVLFSFVFFRGRSVLCPRQKVCYF